MDLILESIPGVKFITQRANSTSATSTTTATTTTATSPIRSVPPVVTRQSQTLSTNDGYSFTVGPLPAAPVPYIVTTEEEATAQVDELVSVLKVCGQGS